VPYFWYGFGNGGMQQRAQSETGFLQRPAPAKPAAATDLNGDGDTLDTVIVANASVTRTNRPGVTSSLTWTMGDHTILGGFWYERAKHRPDRHHGPGGRLRHAVRLLPAGRAIKPCRRQPVPEPRLGDDFDRLPGLPARHRVADGRQADHQFRRAYPAHQA
jgi:hypothetical protein